jgi:class 3 adenylate cyclase
MEPQIRYARTTDGVHIAYAIIGEGTPLVFTSNVWGDLQWYRHDDRCQRQVDGFVETGWMVLRYDGRGAGSSDRNVTDYSLESRVLDFEAVVQNAGFERFVLCGYGQGGPAAIVYSIKNPDRVSHLILVNSFADGSAYYDTIPAMRALITLHAMAEDQWEFFTDTLATAATGFEDADRARRTARLFRGSMSSAAFMSYVNAAREIDVRPLLAGVNVPTLVVQDGAGFRTDALSRELASSIPGAYFVTADDYTSELRQFASGRKGGVQPRERHERAASHSGMAVILFTDIADSTALTERSGDAAFRAAARGLDERLRNAMESANGTPIKGRLLGDGVLATFSSARDAVGAARRCLELSRDVEMPLHIGIHAGDVIREEDNVYGGAVNIASRICGLCEPGEILVSQTVRDLARTSAGVTFEDRGEQALKGIGDPVRVFAVRPASSV